MRSRAFGRVLIALATAACAVALAGTTNGASAAVTIDGFRFMPSSVTVTTGETVTWTNRDPAQHTATAAGAFDTGVLSMGQSKVIQLNTVGTFEYRCDIHTAMAGTVRVVAAPTSSPIPPTIAPTPAPTVAPTPASTPTPVTAAPTPSAAPATTAPATVVPSAVAQSSPSPRSDPPTPGTPPPPPSPDSGPGPTLAALAVLAAAALVGAGVYLARRR